MSAQPKLTTLQALRAVAATFVVAMHATDVGNHYAGQTAWWAGAVQNAGASGVDIFFVISGFVMFYTVRELPPSPASARYFLLRRLIRIVPMYWLVTSFILAAMWLMPSAFSYPGRDAWHIISSYLFIPSLDRDGNAYPVLGVGWTLNYEMYFYVVMAFFLLWHRRFAHLCPFFAATILAGYLLKPQGVLPQCATSILMAEFLYGGAVAYFLRARTLPCPQLFIALGIAWFILTLNAFPASHDNLRTLNLGGSIAFCMAGLLSLETAGRLRVPALLVRLGDSSYSLYLSHMLLFSLLIRAPRDLVPANTMALVTVAAIALAIMAAHALYVFIEKPVTLALNAMLNHQLPQHKDT